MDLTVFHLAVPVRNIEESREFYRDVLGCSEGRSAETWVDFDFFGHQFVIHLNPNLGKNGKIDLHYNSVDKHAIPVPHYGIVMAMENWKTLASRLEDLGTQFVVKPYIRFEGEPGEQATLFFLDPSGNALEFKGFKKMSSLFAKA